MNPRKRNSVQGRTEHKGVSHGESWFIWNTSFLSSCGVAMFTSQSTICAGCLDIKWSYQALHQLSFKYYSVLKRWIRHPNTFCVWRQSLHSHQIRTDGTSNLLSSWQYQIRSFKCSWLESCSMDDMPSLLMIRCWAIADRESLEDYDTKTSSLDMPRHGLWIFPAGLELSWILYVQDIYLPVAANCDSYDQYEGSNMHDAGLRYRAMNGSINI